MLRRNKTERRCKKGKTARRTGEKGSVGTKDKAQLTVGHETGMKDSEQ